MNDNDEYERIGGYNGEIASKIARVSPTLEVPMAKIYDDRLLSVEILNINKKRIVATRDIDQDWYVKKAGKPIGPMRVLLEPDHRYLLPHHFYKIAFEGSSEIAPVLAIYGDKIGTGETKQSRPEPAKTFF